MRDNCCIVNMSMYSMLKLSVIIVCCTSNTFGKLFFENDSCPQQCSCSKDLREVNCNNRGLSSIPKNIPTCVEKLSLDGNKIIKIENDAFAQLQNLTQLSLKKDQISDIEKDGFAGLKKLKSLDLSTNKLKKLEPNVFRDLHSLTSIYFTQNELTEFPDLSMSPNLSTLVLDTNKITNGSFPECYRHNVAITGIILSNNDGLTVIDFENVHVGSVTKFACSRCKLKQLQKDMFTLFVNLQSLDLSYNNDLNLEDFQKVLASLAKSKRLSSLNFASIVKNWRITGDVFKPLEDKKSLYNLVLKDSIFATILSGMFVHLSQLKTLDISNSQVSVIEDGVFSDLSKLTRLLLNKNKLGTVPQLLLPALEYLDLSGNGIEELYDGTFVNLTSLTTLNLVKCNIRTLHTDAFIGLSALTKLDLSENKIPGNAIGNNMLSNMPALNYLSLARNKMQKIINDEDIFKDLTQLLVLDMSSNDCLDIPSGIFRPLVNLQKLLLNGNKFGYFIVAKSDVFDGLFNLTEIHMEQNELSILPRTLFHDLRNLQTLKLGSNSLSRWDDNTFVPLRNLRNLDLSNNKISVINQSSVAGWNYPLQVDLSTNSFNCWCDLRWFRRWMDVTNVTWLNLNDKTYKCDSPTRFANTPLMAFDPATIDQECTPPPWKLFLIEGMAGLVVVVIIVVTVCYCCRWRIKICCFQCRHRRKRRTERGDYESLNDEFDLFVTNHENDQAWVVTLLKTLVPLRLRIFSEATNVTPDMILIKEFGKALIASRAVILVLSCQYMKSKMYQAYLQWIVDAMTERYGSHMMEYIYMVLLESEGEIIPRLPSMLRNGIRRRAENLFTWPESETEQELLLKMLHLRIRVRLIGAVSGQGEQNINSASDDDDDDNGGGSKRLTESDTLRSSPAVHNHYLINSEAQPVLSGLARSPTYDV